MNKKNKAVITGTVVLLSLIVTIPVTFADVYVRGYFRKDGTYVAPHYRSDPDGNFGNNWSTLGNINPYTGEIGTKVTESYSNYYTPSYRTYDSYSYSDFFDGDNSIDWYEEYLNKLEDDQPNYFQPSPTLILSSEQPDDSVENDEPFTDQEKREFKASRKKEMEEFQKMVEQTKIQLSKNKAGTNNIPINVDEVSKLPLSTIKEMDAVLASENTKKENKNVVNETEETSIVVKVVSSCKKFIYDLFN